MNEKLSINSVENNKEEEIDIEEIGMDVEFPQKVIIPEEGTVAHDRLIQVCKEYTRAVDRQNTPQNFLREGFIELSDKNRRHWHNKLCIMLYGSRWEELDKTDKDKISNFAVIIGGRKNKYFGKF